MSTDSEPMYENTAASPELAEMPVRLPDDDRTTDEAEVPDATPDHDDDSP